MYIASISKVPAPREVVVVDPGSAVPLADLAHVCIYVCTYVCVYVCMRIYMYVIIITYIYIYIYIYIFCMYN